MDRCVGLVVVTDRCGQLEVALLDSDEQEWVVAADGVADELAARLLALL